MSAQPRVLVIVVYFGNFPVYFNHTLKSMEMNRDIDWLFVSDQELQNQSENIQLWRMSFSDFVQFVQRSYDFPVGLTTPYKICDFRPAFGELFSSFLANYDYWGHCDLDVIFGNIRRILPNTAWGADRVFARGSLSFYRNSPQINSLYRSNLEGTLDYKEVFTNPNSTYFDEWHGVNKKFYAKGLQIWDDTNYFFDIDKNRFNLTTTDHQRIKVLITSDSRIFMQHKTTKESIEGAYLHLQKRKIEIGPNLNDTCDLILTYNTIVSANNSELGIIFKTQRVFYFYQNRGLALLRRIRKLFD